MQHDTFAHFGLDERVLAQVRTLGYRVPTKVQSRAIPLMMQKHNLLVEAPTGSGKTAAYGLPLLSRLDLLKRATHALVLVPTRELAQQVGKALRSFHDSPLLRVGIVTGGSSLEDSAALVKRTPHIVVAVPGRLREVLSTFQYDFFWRNIKWLIVDEGDKLLEAGFQQEFDYIHRHVRGTAQTCFFSATVSADAEAMIRERVQPLNVVRLSPKDVLGNIRFCQVDVPQGRREATLLDLLAQAEIGQALVFAGRRQSIQAVTNFLRNAGLRADAYHGMQEQAERQNILERFKAGHLDYLVASDLAARGLDIEALPAVINLRIPQEYDFYLHRVGRTGRAGNRGQVFNLVVSAAEAAYLANHHRLMGIRLLPMAVTPGAAAQADAPADSTWLKLHLSRGKGDKLRKGDVVGFLVNHAAVPADEIGTITIYDSYTTVDVPDHALQYLDDQARDLAIKGLSVKVRKVSADEQSKKAEHTKSLLRDRRPARRTMAPSERPAADPASAQKPAAEKPARKPTQKPARKPSGGQFPAQPAPRPGRKPTLKTPLKAAPRKPTPRKPTKP